MHRGREHDKNRYDNMKANASVEFNERNTLMHTRMAFGWSVPMMTIESAPIPCTTHMHTLQYRAGFFLLSSL